MECKTILQHRWRRLIQVYAVHRSEPIAGWAVCHNFPIVNNYAKKAAVAHLIIKAVGQAYQQQFSRSKTTLERDLEDLRQRGLMRFDGEKRTGSWRCA